MQSYVSLYFRGWVYRRHVYRPMRNILPVTSGTLPIERYHVEVATDVFEAFAH